MMIKVVNQTSAAIMLGGVVLLIPALETDVDENAVGLQKLIAEGKVREVKGEAKTQTASRKKAD